MLTKDLLHELFEYQDGELHWKSLKKRAGGCNDQGYIKIKINGKLYSAHRLIFVMFHGYMPSVIDHVDGIRHNNKIKNLREATVQENCWNRSVESNTFSNVKGISWHKDSNKWQAKLTIDGKQKTLGYFQDLEEAKKVIKQHRSSIHGNFAKH
jgi:hypothetical protein